jgi:hypothetical protein
LTAGAIGKVLNYVEELQVEVDAPERSNKIELGEKIHFTTIEL